ncbi:hypothetical protein Ciccas_012534, partial [Cichlidogyrus casuarinus]
MRRVNILLNQLPGPARESIFAKLKFPSREEFAAYQELLKCRETYKKELGSLEKTVRSIKLSMVKVVSIFFG